MSQVTFRCWNGYFVNKLARHVCIDAIILRDGVHVLFFQYIWELFKYIDSVGMYVCYAMGMIKP